MPSKRNPGHRTRLCSVAGCTRKHSAKGFCPLHYMRKHAGRAEALFCADCPTPREDGRSRYCAACRARRANAPLPKCGHDGCERETWRRGVRYCSTHHSRVYRKSPMAAVCPGCGKPAARLNKRCRKCARKAKGQRNADWFARKKAADPAWWEMRKAKVAAAYHAKKAAQPQTPEAA